MIKIWDCFSNKNIL